MKNFFIKKKIYKLDTPVQIESNWQTKLKKIINILYVTSIIFLVFFTALYFLQYRLVVRFENISPLISGVVQ